jgi:hypothetical protein
MRPSVERLRSLFTYDEVTGVLSHVNGVEAGYTDKRNYRVVMIDRKKVYAHTLIWALVSGEYPDGTVDHKDLDGLNNRWFNLRVASQAQQQANRRVFKNSKTGIRGVYPSGKKFIAQVRYDTKTRTLGTFDTAEAAGSAVQKAREARWGEFARV